MKPCFKGQSHKEKTDMRLFFFFYQQIPSEHSSAIDSWHQVPRSQPGVCPSTLIHHWFPVSLQLLWCSLTVPCREATHYCKFFAMLCPLLPFLVTLFTSWRPSTLYLHLQSFLSQNLPSFTLVHFPSEFSPVSFVQWVTHISQILASLRFNAFSPISTFCDSSRTPWGKNETAPFKDSFDCQATPLIYIYR